MDRITNSFSTRFPTYEKLKKEPVETTWTGCPAPTLRTISKKKIETFDPMGEKIAHPHIQALRKTAKGKGYKAARAAYRLSQHYRNAKEEHDTYGLPKTKIQKRETYWLETSEMKLKEIGDVLNSKEQELQKVVVARMTEKDDKIANNWFKQYLPSGGLAGVGVGVAAGAVAAGPIGWAIGGTAIVAGAIGIGASFAWGAFRAEGATLAKMRAKNDMANLNKNSSTEQDSPVDLDDPTEISHTRQNTFDGSSDDRIEIPDNQSALTQSRLA